MNPLLALLAGSLLKVMIARPPEPLAFLGSLQLPAVYADVAWIKQLENTPELDPTSAARLADPKTPLEEKIAGALSFTSRFGFTELASTYAMTVYEKPLAQLRSASLRGDELLVLGLLTASMPDDAPRALTLVQLARKKLPRSFAVALLTAAMEGHLAAAKKQDTCAIFRLPFEVLRNEKLTQDLRQAGVDAFFDDAASFRDICSNVLPR